VRIDLDRWPRRGCRGEKKEVVERVKFPGRICLLGASRAGQQSNEHVTFLDELSDPIP
jgi:hypothetical protein